MNDIIKKAEDELGYEAIADMISYLNRIKRKGRLGNNFGIFIIAYWHFPPCMVSFTYFYIGAGWPLNE